MSNETNFKVVDADFTEVTNQEGEDTTINGEPLYYSTGQVAEKLEESESTVRYWCDEFDEALQIKRHGRNRSFTKRDIEKLEYIKYLLKVEKLKVRQVQEFLQREEAKMMSPVPKDKEEFFIRAVSQIVVTEMEQRFRSLEDRIMERITTQNQNNLLLEAQSFAREREDIVNEAVQKIHEELEKQGNNLLGKIDSKLEEQDSSKNKAELIQELTKEIESNLSKHSESINSNLDIKLQEREDKLLKYVEELRKSVEEPKRKGFFTRLLGG